MVQCPDCEAKDRITIAGQVFCANCGTQWVGTDTAGAASTAPAPTPIAAVEADTAPAPIVVPTVSEAPKPVAPVIPASPLAAAPAPTPTPEPTLPQAPPPSAHLEIKKPQNHAEVAAQIGQTGSISKFGQTQVATPAPKLELDQSPPALSVNSAAPADADIEIGTLDKAQASVLSDDQFNNLAQLDNQPVQPPQTEEAAPVVVAAAPAAPAPASPAPTPAAIPIAVAPVAPIPQPASISAPTPAMPANARLQDVVMSPPNQATQAQSASHAAVSSTKLVLPRPASAVEIAARRGNLVPPSEPVNAVNAIGGNVTKQQALDMALSAGDSPPSSTPSFGPLKAAVVVVLLLLVGGYIWQVNYPNLALKVAAARAGLVAIPPSYLPDGWSINRNITSTSGKVGYTATSTDGKQRLVVTQTKSTWDSRAVLENYVLPQATSYTAVSDQGLTIYVYGNQATWVNGGSWFTIDGSSSNLSQEQIIKIATNL